jgi:hypothetical protein
MRIPLMALLLAGAFAMAFGLENDLKVGDTWTYTLAETEYRTSLQKQFDGISRLTILDSATRNDTVFYTVVTLDSGLYRGESPKQPVDTVIARTDTIGWSGQRFLGISGNSQGIQRPAIFLGYFNSLKMLRSTVVYDGDTLSLDRIQGYEGSVQWLPRWGVIMQSLCYGCGGTPNSSSRSLNLVSRNGRKFDPNRLVILNTTPIAIAKPHTPSRIRPGNPGWGPHTLDGRAVPESGRYRGRLDPARNRAYIQAPGGHG